MSILWDNRPETFLDFFKSSCACNCAHVGTARTTAYIVQLQNEAEEWLKTTEHSRAIADSINLTSQHAFDAVAMFGDKSTMTDMVINSPEFINQRNQINTDFDNIAQLVKNSPKEVNIATSAKSLCNTTLDELVKIMEVRAKADPANKPLIKNSGKKCA
ncbi:MAG: hypothetical protein IPL73_19495 [Candidatus Obscuribacter sp.]|nr:hypothetical protein [Candidatus Obscuribacter sp.]